MAQVTCIEFFTYQGFRNKRWALAQMRNFHPSMKNVPGLSFYKLLGSGAGNGFSLWPDLGAFCLISTWDSSELLEDFRKAHNVYQEMHLRSVDWKGTRVRAIKGHGTWNGKQPFNVEKGLDGTYPIAVITRASIDKRKAWMFWKHVPGVSRRIQDSTGLIYAKGVGELPLVEQATVSFWQNAEALQNFAYGTGGKHKPMVKMTREVGWYSEEMFMRFQVEKWEGSFSAMEA